MAVCRRYAASMSADTTGTGVKVTTVKITEQTRFRLAQLAEEAGTTIKDLIAELAASRSTAEEVRQRTAAVAAMAVADRQRLGISVVLMLGLFSFRSAAVPAPLLEGVGISSGAIA